MLLRDFHLPLFVTDKWVKCYCELILGLASLHVQSILASSRDDMTVNQLSELADRILEVASPSLPSVSNITAVASGSAALRS